MPSSSSSRVPGNAFFKVRCHLAAVRQGTCAGLANTVLLDTVSRMHSAATSETARMLLIKTSSIHFPGVRHKNTCDSTALFLQMIFVCRGTLREGTRSGGVEYGMTERFGAADA